MLRSNGWLIPGLLAGPDILAAGVYVTPELGNSDAILADPRLYKYANRQLHGEEALREVVSINADRGVDWIKTRSSGLSSRTGGPDALALVYDHDELSAIVDEAARHDIPVSCHAHGVEVVIAAIKAGCASIEHASYVDDEGLRLMKEFDTLWIPTYISVTGFQLPHDDYNTPIARQRWPHLVENLGRMIGKGHALGITILTAVDSGYGPESVYRVAGEINAFIEFGMTPLEALAVGDRPLGGGLRPGRPDRCCRSRPRGRLAGLRSQSAGATIGPAQSPACPEQRSGRSQPARWGEQDIAGPLDRFASQPRGQDRGAYQGGLTRIRRY